MKKLALLTMILTLTIAPLGCTNMTKTQQGALSGAGIGALGGAGIGAIAGGSGTTGALIGGALGGIAGGIYGHNQE